MVWAPQFFKALQISLTGLAICELSNSCAKFTGAENRFVSQYFVAFANHSTHSRIERRRFFLIVSIIELNKTRLNASSNPHIGIL